MWTRSAHENSYCSSSTLYMYKHIFFLKTLNLWEGNFNFFIWGGGVTGEHVLVTTFWYDYTCLLTYFIGPL